MPKRLSDSANRGIFGRVKVARRPQKVAGQVILGDRRMAVGALKPSYVSPIPVADEPSYGEQYARLLDAALRGDFSLIKRG